MSVVTKQEASREREISHVLSWLRLETFSSMKAVKSSVWCSQGIAGAFGNRADLVSQELIKQLAKSETLLMLLPSNDQSSRVQHLAGLVASDLVFLAMAFSAGFKAVFGIDGFC